MKNHKQWNDDLIDMWGFVLPIEIRPRQSTHDEATLWKMLIAGDYVESDFRNLEKVYKQIIQLQEECMSCFDNYEYVLKELGDRIVEVIHNYNQRDEINEITFVKAKMDNVRELWKRERLRFRKSLKDAKNHMRKSNTVKSMAELIAYKDKLRSCLENVLNDIDIIEKAFECVRTLLSELNIYSRIIKEVENYEKAETEMWKMLLKISKEYFNFNRCIPANLQLFEQILDKSLKHARELANKYTETSDSVNKSLDLIDSFLGSCFKERVNNKEGKDLVSEIWRGNDESRFWDISQYHAPDISIEEIEQMIQLYTNTLNEMIGSSNMVPTTALEWVYTGATEKKDIRSFPKSIEKLKNILADVMKMLKEEKEEQYRWRQSEGGNGTETGGNTDEDTDTNTNTNTDTEKRGETETGATGTATKLQKKSGTEEKRKKSIRFQKILEYMSVVGNEMYYMMPYVHDIERAREFDRVSQTVYKKIEQHFPDVNKRNNLLLTLLTSLRHSIMAVPHIIKSYMQVIDYDCWEKKYLEGILNFSRNKTENAQLNLITTHGLPSMVTFSKGLETETKTFGRTILLYIIEIITNMEEMYNEVKTAGDHITKWETYNHQPVEAGSFTNFIKTLISKIENIISLHGAVLTDLVYELKQLSKKKPDLEALTENFINIKQGIDNKIKLIKNKLKGIKINTSKEDYQICRDEVYNLFDSLVSESRFLAMQNFNAIIEKLESESESKLELDIETATIKRLLIDLQNRALDFAEFSFTYKTDLIDALEGSLTGINDIINRPVYLNKIEKCYSILIVYLHNVLSDIHKRIKQAGNLSLKWESVLKIKIEEMKKQRETSEADQQLQSFENEVKQYVTEIKSIVNDVEASTKSINERAENIFDELTHLAWKLEDYVDIPSFNKAKESIKQKIDAIKSLLQGDMKTNPEQNEKKKQSQIQLQNQKQQIKNAKMALTQLIEVINVVFFFVKDLKETEQQLEYNIRVASVFIELKKNRPSANQKLIFFRKLIEGLTVHTLKEEFAIGEITLNMLLFEQVETYATEKTEIQTELVLLRRDLNYELKILPHYPYGKSHLQYFFHEIAEHVTMFTIRRHYIAERIAHIKEKMREIIKKRKVDMEVKGMEYVIQRILNMERNMLNCFHIIHRGLQGMVDQYIKGKKATLKKKFKLLLEVKNKIRQKIERLQMEKRRLLKIKSQAKLDTLVENVKNDMKALQKLNKNLMPNFNTLRKLALFSKQPAVCIRVLNRYRTIGMTLKSASNKKIKELLIAMEYSIHFHSVLHSELVFLSDKNMYPIENEKEEEYNNILNVTKIYSHVTDSFSIIQQTDVIYKKTAKDYIESEYVKINKCIYCRAVLRRLEKELCEAQCIYKCAEITLSNWFKYCSELKEASEDMDKQRSVVLEKMKNIRRMVLELSKTNAPKQQKTEKNTETQNTEEDVMSYVIGAMNALKNINDDIRVIKMHFHIFLYAQIILKSLNKKICSVTEELKYIRAQYAHLKYLAKSYENEIKNVDLEILMRPQLVQVTKMKMRETKELISEINRLLDLADQFASNMEKERHDIDYWLFLLEKLIVYAIDIADKLKQIKFHFTNRFRPLMKAARLGETDLTKLIQILVRRDRREIIKQTENNTITIILETEKKLIEEEKKKMEKDKQLGNDKLQIQKNTHLFKIPTFRPPIDITRLDNKMKMFFSKELSYLVSSQNNSLSSISFYYEEPDPMHVSALNLDALNALDNPCSELQTKMKDLNKIDPFVFLSLDICADKSQWSLLCRNLREYEKNAFKKGNNGKEKTNRNTKNFNKSQWELESESESEPELVSDSDWESGSEITNTNKNHPATYTNINMNLNVNTNSNTNMSTNNNTHNSTTYKADTQ